MPEAPARNFGRLWGRSEAFLACLRRLEEVAPSETTVLIEGETGTGKELAAEAIHLHSPRRDSPYVVVDCASVPKELIESELFGHIRGAFTGAEADRRGAFEAAAGGTVFIDEIGELPLDLQARILGVLERRVVKRVGADSPKKVDVRVIAATNRDLSREVKHGRFREDLLFRLDVVKVVLPPLRDRPEDVDFLAQRFLEEHRHEGATLELRPESRARLMGHGWPGNVRELRNVIERGASLSDRFFRVPDDLEQSYLLARSAAHLLEDGAEVLGGGGHAPLPRAVTPRPTLPAPPPVAAPPPGPGDLTRPLWHGRNYKEAKDAVLEDFERGYITALLDAHHGNVSAAARAAGIHRNILHRMMARYGIAR